MFDIFLCIWYTIFMKKDMFTINKNGLSYGRGYVYSLQYHLVWCTKYRKKVLKDGIDVECKEMLESLAQEYKFQILAMEVMPDHIHLLVDCQTTVLYFRHDQNHEGESCAPDVPFVSRAKERVVGRAFVESVLLCCNGQ